MKPENFKKLIFDVKKAGDGWTDITIGDEIGVSHMTIWRLANGKVADPLYSTAVNLINLRDKVCKKRSKQ